MDWTIHFGTWVIPAFLTIIFYGLAHNGSRKDDWGILWLWFNGLATIGSLVAWLVWALLR